jgi:8-oxo-dGTP diphosphatase
MLINTLISTHLMRPFVTDAMIVRDGRIVLIRRKNEPFKGKWALPGGFAEADETAEQCCAREALEETGLSVRVKKLIGVFSGPDRDPRGTVAAAYLCEAVGGELKGGDDAKEAKWFPLKELPELGFDHEKIIEEGKKLIR